jgi:outer membrane lipoprotein SlyB
MSGLFAKSVIATAIASMAVASASPALARHYYNDGYYQNSNDGYYQNSRYDDRGYGRNDDRDYGYREDRGYRCNGGGKGTGGTIIGAIAGGLLGRAVVGRYGDRTAGTIVGAGAGALAGRALDKSSSRNRC